MNLRTDEPSTRVRPEYAALAEEFVALAADFGHRIDTELRRDIARLAATMECIDRHVDDVTDDVRRRTLWASVLDLLERGEERDERDERDELAEELARATLAVRELAIRRHVLARIVRIVRKEIATSEQLRDASDVDDYVRGVLREGRLTAALALVVAGPACGAAFRRFFFRLAGPANVIDKLNDAADDHARGEIRLQPGLELHARLALAVAVRLPSLLASHPSLGRVITLGVKYLRRPRTGSTPRAARPREMPSRSRRGALGS